MLCKLNQEISYKGQSIGNIEMLHKGLKILKRNL